MKLYIAIKRYSPPPALKKKSYTVTFGKKCDFWTGEPSSPPFANQTPQWYISTMGKQLNIKSDRAYQLASELAARNGMGLTEAVLHALEQAKAERPPPSAAKVQATLAEWNRLIDLDVEALRASGLRFDSDKELYDEDGIPI